MAIWPPLTLLVLLVTWPFDRDRRVAGRFFRYLGVIWSRCFPFWRIRIEGRWPRAAGAFVVVSNHQSFLDIFVLCNVRHELKWIAKKELFSLPVIGWSLRMVGDICLERGDPGSAIAAMATARRYLQHGTSVMIFPEGTRSRDGTLLPFKPGAFKLAIEAGVPILPIALSGSAQGMPKGGPWVRPARLVVRILDPVPTEGLTAADVRKVRDEVRERIARAIGSPTAPVAAAE